MAAKMSVEGIDRILANLIPEDRFANFAELREAAKMRYMGDAENSANKKIVTKAHIEVSLNCG
jgi:high-affinity K+ transport system ATPase subunit B